jgi:hexosaminidase
LNFFQGYILCVLDGTTYVGGSDGAGLFYGIQTLLQLEAITNGAASSASKEKEESKEGRVRGMTLPPLRIADAPRFVWRGLMLDSARHFQTVAFIKKRIDILASLKINVLHWHVTDDQGANDE